MVNETEGHSVINFGDWMDKSNEIQRIMRELSLELRDIKVKGDNLKAVKLQLKQFSEKYFKFDKEFLEWVEPSEILSYRFPTTIPAQLIESPVSYYYGHVVMHRTAMLALQRVQITDGLNLRLSEYSWWKAYKKTILGLWIAVAGMFIAIAGTVIAICK